MTTEIKRPDCDFIANEARDEGWDAIGITFCGEDGGVILFQREVAPFEDKDWGTASFHYNPNSEAGELVFNWGHYDLTEDEARKDYAMRVERGY